MQIEILGTGCARCKETPAVVIDGKIDANFLVTDISNIKITNLLGNVVYENTGLTLKNTLINLHSLN